MKTENNKALIDSGKMLPLMEEFYTIQGEGGHTGAAAYFIRVGGCDVGCHWCDVKESWDANLHPPTLTDTIVANAKKHGGIVVITGGEPLIYAMDYITQQLKENGMRTHIETSGAYPLSGDWDWFCLSPKKSKKPIAECYGAADELKMIIQNKSDFRYAEEEAAKVGSHCKLYMQAEWSKKEKMTPFIVDYVMKNSQWKISVQTHKYLNIP
jgi:7-carboxy-7-deazaguanine synthase